MSTTLHPFPLCSYKMSNLPPLALHFYNMSTSPPPLRLRSYKISTTLPLRLRSYKMSTLPHVCATKSPTHENFLFYVTKPYLPNCFVRLEDDSQEDHQEGEIPWRGSCYSFFPNSTSFDLAAEACKVGEFRGFLLVILKKCRLCPGVNHRKRINTRRKAKVVTAFWGQSLFNSLAPLALMHQYNLKKRMNSSFSSYHPCVINPVF